MKLNVLLFSALTVILTTNCEQSYPPEKSKFPKVVATYETEPVAADKDMDAADDPAIWYNSASPENSLIIGTDKKRGLGVYNLKGKQLFFSSVGRVNNVDVLPSFPVGDSTITLVGASNRSTNTITLMSLNSDGTLQQFPGDGQLSKVGEVYGFCFAYKYSTHEYYAFVSGKEGEVEQWSLRYNGEKIELKLERSIKLATQVEGMVADSLTGKVFIAEEDHGIWEYSIDPKAKIEPIKIEVSDPKNNKNILDDVEGLALYKKKDGSGYLVASSQGNNSYAFFDRQNPTNYLGSIVVTSGVIDAVEETDGIEVSSHDFGPDFPKGIFLAQDGFNYDNNTKTSQNFKIMDWQSIEEILKKDNGSVAVD